MSEEEEIIKQGLKSHTKTDTFCYIGIGLLAIMIIIPPVFRQVFKDLRPKDTIETIIYMEIKCRHTYRDNKNNIVTEEFIGNYRDAKVQKIRIEFRSQGEENNLTDPRITPLIDLKDATGNKIVMKEEKTTLAFEMDFKANKDMFQMEAFAPYTKQAPSQLTEYRIMGYLCLTESEEKEEDISKVEE
jgi:hypothetical protein